MREITPRGIIESRANLLWDIKNEEAIKVCVVDTGYYSGHEDLPSPKYVSGTNTDRSLGTWDEDGNGHGTHCAGTIGAVSFNNIGVSSVMGREGSFKFHIGKGLNSEGSGRTSSIMAAVRGCTEANAKVISMSLGGSSGNPSESDFYRSIFDEVQ